MLTPLTGFSVLSPPKLSSSTATTFASPHHPACCCPLGSLPASITSGSISSTIIRSRCSGWLLSSGTYAPPDFSTPKIAMTISRERSTATPTRLSGPTPSRCSRCATWLARAFSSAKFSRRTPISTAIRSPACRACSSTHSCTHRARSYFFTVLLICPNQLSSCWLIISNCSISAPAPLFTISCITCTAWSSKRSPSNRPSAYSSSRVVASLLASHLNSIGHLSCLIPSRFSSTRTPPLSHSPCSFR